MGHRSHYLQCSIRRILFQSTGGYDLHLPHNAEGTVFFTDSTLKLRLGSLWPNGVGVIVKSRTDVIDSVHCIGLEYTSVGESTTSFPLQMAFWRAKRHWIRKRKPLDTSHGEPAFALVFDGM